MPEWTLEQLAVAVLVVIAFIILLVVVTGFKGLSNIWYSSCTGKIGGDWNASAKGYENPICTIYKKNDSCIIAYPNITIGDYNYSICIWSETAKACVFNPVLSCSDFSQTTVPKCQDVPDCRPTNAIKMAIERLMPK
ncbi:MAG: hypothetical protein ACP5JY_02885 [Candidatus Nanoarchaeia archaeon]